MLVTNFMSTQYHNLKRNRYVFCVWQTALIPDDDWLLAFKRNDDSTNASFYASSLCGINVVNPLFDTKYWLSLSDIKKLEHHLHVKLEVIKVNNFPKFVKDRLGNNDYYNCINRVHKFVQQEVQ